MTSASNAATPDMKRIRRAIRSFDFTTLFIEELGWDRFKAEPLAVSAAGEPFTLQPVAQKRGVVVLVCAPNAQGGIPDKATRKKIDAEARKQYHEHLLIYADAGKTQQIWQWVKHQPGRPTAYREEKYFEGQSGERLAQRLSQLYVDLLEEEELTLTDVSERLQAFDVDKVTKKFYDRFQAEHKLFVQAISGIALEDDREWYASLMLNRLMFSYFIQRKGFLDNDTHYLRNKLGQMQARFGADQFHTFYREFLLRFFHDGLGAHVESRSPEIRALIGAIPYLNGGLFEAHQIENSNRAIAIPDAAFARIFDFFDDYSWHLDDRPMRDDKEINPDVLGYIFEKYINQKQMGAYYTKEDITGYIGKNTILPFLFESARKECRIAFEPEGEVWRLLRDDPDRYIYEAVRTGIDLELPPAIAAGIDDVAQRGGWNRPAASGYALPTETWREHIARRTRCLDLRAKLANGELHEVNDLITYNLDIVQFAQDVIEHCEGPELLRAIWKALASVTVLDPTCGSGAFLFAALRLLEPLYEACLLRMESFVTDFDREGHAQRGPDFREVLARVAAHPNRGYFIRKAIILNNLYGVDIMEEAVEIAKLRLFLTLVSQVNDARDLEPLPDIDFNIRAGNTLVGFTTLDAVREAMMYGPNGQMRMLSAEDEAILSSINERAEIASRAYQQFQRMQSEHGMDAAAFRNAKVELRQRLAELRGELDHYLAREYGIPATDDLFKFEPWRKSHQPFHWFVEFYAIVQERGGFDVIIGNPPYVEYSKVRSLYSIKRDIFRTAECGNLFAFVAERALSLLCSKGHSGLIVLLASFGTTRMLPLQQVYRERCDVVTASHYEATSHPSVIFVGVEAQLSIILSRRVPPESPNEGNFYTTNYIRTYSVERPHLFDRVRYSPLPQYLWNQKMPRLSAPFEISILAKLQVKGRSSAEAREIESESLLFRTMGNFFWKLAFTQEPLFQINGVQQRSSTLSEIQVPRPREVLQALTYSSLFYWYWAIYSDVYHLTKSDITGFPFSIYKLSAEHSNRLAELARSVEHELFRTAKIGDYQRRNGHYIFHRFFPHSSKPIIDEIDRVLAQHYGFSDEELDFIINYDIKYRMGADSGESGNGDGEE